MIPTSSHMSGNYARPGGRYAAINIINYCYSTGLLDAAYIAQLI